MNMHHTTQTVEPEWMWQSAWLLVSGALKPPEPGAVAHMSLHQKLTMSKNSPDTNTGQLITPRFTPGDRLSVYVGDQPSVR